MRVNKKLSEHTPEEIRRLIREALSDQKEKTAQIKEENPSIRKKKDLHCKKGRCKK